MFEFVALLWNREDPQAAANARHIARRLKATSPAWKNTFAAPGLWVFHANNRPGVSEVYHIPSNAGVVLGKLFKAAANPGDGALNLGTESARQILASGGRRLIEEYWGRYVAFVHDDRAHRTWVLRDPSGDLPCYNTRHDGVSVYFSCAETVASVGLLAFQPNWDYIAAFVCFPTMAHSVETGLAGVSEIGNGECWEIDATTNVKRQQYWNPVEIACSNIIEDLNEAVRAVRRTTQACVWAWAQCFPRIVHLLSGGLDSSIVLSCLNSAPVRPRITCLNYFDTSSPAGDEREYARATVDGTGLELIEAPHGLTGGGLEPLLEISRSVKPYLSQYYVSHTAFEGRLAREKEASALFYGAGGDEVFFQGPIGHSAGDYAHRCGVDRKFLRVVAAVARGEGVSFWAALSKAVRQSLLRSRWDLISRMREHGPYLVPPDVLEAVLHRENYLIRPWLKEADALPWGKREHVRVVSCWLDFFDPLAPADFPQRVRPLVSQPLIELCLRIPTYVLATNGVDRAVARRAFAADLPPRVARRRAKGMIDSSLYELLRRNWTFIRDFMLDGHLVGAGILDRRKLTELFTGQRPSLGPEAQELVVLHLSTEAWLKSWNRANQEPVFSDTSRSVSAS